MSASGGVARQTCFICALGLMLASLSSNKGEVESQACDFFLSLFKSKNVRVRTAAPVICGITMFFKEMHPHS